MYIIKLTKKIEIKKDEKKMTYTLLYKLVFLFCLLMVQKYFPPAPQWIVLHTPWGVCTLLWRQLT